MKFAYLPFLLICLFNYHLVKSQYYFSAGNKMEPEPLWELGITAGAINCLTDIGGHSGTGKKFIKDINWNKMQVCIGAFVSTTWPKGIGIRADVMYGQIAGSDAVLKNTNGIAQARYLRNLQFKTSIVEASIATELFPLTILSNSDEAKLFSPYILAGMGFFYYKPQAYINQAWIDLRSLHTEGEGFAEIQDSKPYGPISWCVPLGFGVKYDVSGFINFRVEFVYRFTGTDYLDDVSKRYIDPSLFKKYLSPTQAALALKLADRSAELTNGVANKVNDIRGNPSNNDAYFSASLKISLALGRK